MNEIKLNYRKILEIVLIAIVCYWGLNNFKVVSKLLSNVLSVMMPFIIGFMIAFILNVLMIRVEKGLVKLFKGSVFKRYKRAVSIILSLLIVMLVLAIIIHLIIPELINAIKLIIDILPEALKELEIWSQDNQNIFPYLESWLGKLDFNRITDELSKLLKVGLSGVVGSTVEIITGFFGGVFNFVVGFVFALYILVSKETLKSQTCKLVKAYLPKEKAASVIEVASLSRTTFTNFVIGQTVEAIILGTLCALGMIILGFPYAPMIGTLVGITAFIPVVGAFIGGAIGAFMIMTVNPMQAIFFIVYLIVLQQIEGNLIYPRVVGSTVGLPSIWVLFAVSAGGGLWGIAGVLFGVPVLSVVYSLIKKGVHKRLEILS